MLACGTVPPARAPAVMRVGWLALGLSVIGYWLVGFAFQFGGVGFASAHPELAGLAREWTLSGLDSAWGSQWGVIGLEGTLLQGAARTPAALRLFWSQLPWITTSVAIVLWALQGRTWPIPPRAAHPGSSGPRAGLLVLGGLLQAALYTLIGNWAWGGGWLANLGANLGLGHGFVDYAGSAAVHLLPAASALAALVALPGRAPQAPPDAQQLALPTLAAPGTRQPDVRWTARDEPYVPMPPLHLPVLATAGAWLALLGWLGWCSSTPLETIGGPSLPWPERAIALLLAAAGGALSALLASWLTTGQGNALMTARGVIGALIAVGAGAPFYPLWAALAVGAGAGLLVPLIQYTVDHLLRLEDTTSALATHGVSALWGLLAVGLFASGESGAGWNGVTEAAYAGMAGQGVSGYLVAPGWARDWPGQFQAQAFGAAAIVVSALVASGLLYGLVRGLVRAWVGESLPARAPRSARARPRRTRKTRAGALWARGWARIRALLPPDWPRRRVEPSVSADDADGEADSTAPEPDLAEDGLEPFEPFEPEQAEDEATKALIEPPSEEER
jgi:Amt family ammonium transporter